MAMSFASIGTVEYRELYFNIHGVEVFITHLNEVTSTISGTRYDMSTQERILRTHISISLHSFNALSVNVRKRRPNPMNPAPGL